MSTFYQLETDFRYVNCGMCWALLLDDGSLVVQDGGYFAPGQAEALHDFFTALCPQGVHIRAWLFSHAHQDHIGAFINYVRMYPDTVIDIEERGILTVFIKAVIRMENGIQPYSDEVIQQGIDLCEN